MRGVIYFCVAFAVVLSCLAAGPASASILSGYLTYDGPQHLTPVPFQGGGEDKLQDDSLTKWVDMDGNSTFSAGDRFWGLVTLSEVLASPALSSVGVGGSDQVMVLFASTIGAPGSGSGGPTSFAASPDPATLAALAPLHAAHVGPSTFALILSTPTPAVGLEDPLNWSAGALFPTAAVWGWEATVDLIPGSGDFFDFVGSAALGGFERGSGTITSSVLGPMVKVDVLDFASVTHLGDITLDVGSVTLASAGEVARGWTFRDQSSYFLNPVPEPSAVAIWSVLAVGLLYLRRRTTAGVA